MLISGQVTLSSLKEFHGGFNLGTQISFEVIFLNCKLFLVKVDPLFNFGIWIETFRVVNFQEFDLKFFDDGFLPINLLIRDFFNDLGNHSFQIFYWVNCFLEQKTHDNLSVFCSKTSKLFFHKIVNHIFQPITSLYNWLDKVLYLLLAPEFPFLWAPIFVEVVN